MKHFLKVLQPTVLVLTFIVILLVIYANIDDLKEQRTEAI